jgi:hypothetical protein
LVLLDEFSAVNVLKLDTMLGCLFRNVEFHWCQRGRSARFCYLIVTFALSSVRETLDIPVGNSSDLFLSHTGRPNSRHQSLYFPPKCRWLLQQLCCKIWANNTLTATQTIWIPVTVWHKPADSCSRVTYHLRAPHSVGSCCTEVRVLLFKIATPCMNALSLQYIYCF